MRIEVRGATFDEITENAIPFVRLYPELRPRWRWDVQPTDDGGLVATAETVDVVATPAPPPPPRPSASWTAPPISLLEKPQLEPSIPEWVRHGHQLEHQVQELRGEVYALRREIDRMQGRVSIDDFRDYPLPLRGELLA